MYSIQINENVSSSQRNPQSVNSSSSRVAEYSEPDREHEIGLVFVTGGQDQRFVGPSSGYSFAKIVLGRIGRHKLTNSQAEISVSPSTLPWEAFQSAPAKLPSTI